MQTSTGVDAAGSTLEISAACAAMLQPPSTIDCTGLYTDVVKKTLAPQVRAYAPAVPLWADGSGKQRWIYLPPGTKIDTTNPEEWTFPVGTRVWKEFSRDGLRVETRFFEKLAANDWAYGTYQWNAGATTATLAAGGDFTLPDGSTYHIPTIGECAECHQGRPDKLMGFEQVSLGLSGATGLTLSVLANEGWLSPVPSLTHLTIGDDGTGHAAPALGWLHINCGVSCHNADPGATAFPAGMVLRLDPTALDGRASNGFPSIRTTEGVLAHVMKGTRIVPGDPSSSLLYELIDERGTVQMPPIASLLVDVPDVALVAAWISAMPHAVTPDAGVDASLDAGVDAGDSGVDARAEPGDANDAAHYEDAAHQDAEHESGTHEAGQEDGGVGVSDAAKDTAQADARVD